MSQRTSSSSVRALTGFVAMLFGAERWRTLAAIVLQATIGLVAGVSLLLLVPLLQLVGMNIGDGSLTGIVRWIDRGFAVVGVKPTLLSVLAVYVIVAAASAWLARVQAVLNQTLSLNVITRCRQRLFERVSRTSWAFYSRTR